MPNGCPITQDMKVGIHHIAPTPGGQAPSCELGLGETIPLSSVV
ncbi:hypothetical protein E2C01_058666 [Portunus trituberculatus]|uniref:Uncharacterized protein n=1 Tax=Portunus trituberculatus TaxID=210409 RepID=A0A5B7H624_PORTR|nr:hypothetical protein [Portunus trituberculatus]